MLLYNTEYSAKREVVGMSTKDVIKSTIYEQLGGGTGLSVTNIMLILGAACMIGIYIYLVYRLTGKAAFYSKDLNITIAGLPIITAAIMIAMQSNLIVSLGMVGALSIVRFRNAVKNPLDLLYLFWTISAGIICGVGLTVLAIGLCIIMTLVLILPGFIPDFKASSVLVVRGDAEDINPGEIKEIIAAHSRHSKEKSRCIKGSEAEIIYEITTSGEEELISALKDCGEIRQISFLSHDGEYRI